MFFMTLKEFNQLGKETASEELFRCCGSGKWVSKVMEQYPFLSEQALVEAATVAWYSDCGQTDWLESFTHHPQIGDRKSLRQKFAGKEQEGVADATGEVIDALSSANAEYFKKFGFIFIVCATGRSAEEMLRLLKDRLKNDRGEETRIAMGEQHKITLLRFRKLITNVNFQFLRMSQLTTHVLDTSRGKPGKSISVQLLQQSGNDWTAIAQGITDAEGRITDLLPQETVLPTGTYKLKFETGTYFISLGVKGFYPQVEIQFMVSDQSHYHVPLLVSPFGYSTYRGS
jgi:5-hydroxyisourate hydrolase / 2-oxo-4-hydroxy-4-carboxy-5-ureidoimidazoline decarboxylase